MSARLTVVFLTTSLLVSCVGEVSELDRRASPLDAGPANVNRTDSGAALADSGSAVDAGANDGFDAGSVDAGSSSQDGGTTHFDAGTGHADAGFDAGHVAFDAGTTSADAGTTTVDAGTTTVDAGTTTVDAGTAPVDAGTAPVDAGVLTPGAPVVLYTDTLSAPTAGGEGGQGGYLSIFGKNFGAPTDLGTTTKVFIGTAEVANYRILTAAKVTKLAVQQLTVQVGNLGGAAVGTALPVKVVVNSRPSNTNLTFTPTAGKVLFASLSGNDATAVAGDITKPWRSLQNNSATTGAYYAAAAGDQIVVRGGNWSDTTGVDGTWLRASSNAAARNGTPSAWIHITAYPGPINGNAMEDVHYTTPAGKPGGFQGPWSAIAGTSGEYFAVSNLRLEVNAAAASDAAPINLQYGGGHWRIVNNELGPWPVAGVQAARAGGVSGKGDDVKILGNHIHHIGGTSDLENHGIYIETGSTNVEVAFNWVHDVTGGSLVQFNDSGGGAGTYPLPHGGTWQGFTGVRVHHNWLERGEKYGFNISDAGAGQGQVEARVWNNVIIGTKLPPVRMNSTASTIDVTVAFNTIANAMVSNSGSGNGYFRNEGNGSGAIRIVNNLLAFGANTVTGTDWFYDYSGTSSGWSFKNNLYWDLGRGVTPPSDSAKVLGDPKFVDAANDVALTSASPAIDRGVGALPFTVVDDLTGTLSRPVGAASDLGAYEYQP